MITWIVNHPLLATCILLISYALLVALALLPFRVNKSE